MESALAIRTTAPMGEEPVPRSLRGVKGAAAPPRTEAEREAFWNGIYERFGQATYGFFYRRVGDAAAAADLNQDLYLRLLRSAATFEGRCSSRTWVFALARNVLFEWRRRRWHPLADRVVSLEDDALQSDLALPSDAEARADAALFRDRLKHCLGLLDDAGRAVILGHYFAGMTLRELTEQLGFENPSGSRAVLIGALRRLRRCLAGEGFER